MKYFIFFIFFPIIILLVGCNVESDDRFIVIPKNGKEIFLNMEESEIINRLGQPEISDENKNIICDKIYEYDGITLCCNNNNITSIEISNNKYSIMNGIHIGDFITDIQLLPKYIIGFDVLIDKKFAEKKEIMDYISGEINEAIVIDSYDFYGKELFRAGEYKNEDTTIYSLYIIIEKLSIKSIKLSSTKMVYVDW